MASIDEIMASVAPQQTVISRSGSISSSRVRPIFRGDGIAKRFGAPGDGVLIQVRFDGFLRGALHFGGRGKIREALGEIDGVVLQGQPRHFADHRLGELLSFAGKRELVAGAGARFAGFVFSAIEPAINVRVARYDLDVLARFGKRNRFDEFGAARGSSAPPSTTSRDPRLHYTQPAPIRYCRIAFADSLRRACRAARCSPVPSAVACA